MITFGMDSTIEDLLEADPEVMQGAQASLIMLKAMTCRPSFDGTAGELVIHIPVTFDPDSCLYQTEIQTELKLKGIKKQKEKLKIYIDKETGEKIVQEPTQPKGQTRLDV